MIRTLRNIANSLLVPLISSIFFIWLTISSQNVISGILALIFLSASVYYAYEIFAKKDEEEVVEVVRRFHFPQESKKKSRPMKIPRSYCGYESRDPVRKFFYEVSEPEENRVIYFRETKDGYRVCWAHARRTGWVSILLPGRFGDPDQMVEDIFDGKYAGRDYEACDRLLTDEQARCVQHLFDYEANEYNAELREKKSRAYLYRKGLRRPMSGTKYAFFMQYILQEIARRGMVVSETENVGKDLTVKE
ncbi:MAG: hypothetical protein LUE87_07030 [Lachnospiraceae bacterium]|nr:hypothetical protein [Lachnospiraceae bacterium]